MTDRRTYPGTAAIQRHPPKGTQERSTMDTNVYPFPPRARDEIDPPEPAPPSDAVPLAGGAVYTVKEVSRYLRISLGGTYALVRSGQIPAIKLGNRWVIPKRRFAAWLDLSREGEVSDPTANHRGGV
jgi:excisionase family DNA binding protein